MLFFFAYCFPHGKKRRNKIVTKRVELCSIKKDNTKTCYN